jgi:hypothetical protein
MEVIYTRIKNLARKIVEKFPTQDFYEDYKNEIEMSRNFFKTDAVTNKIYTFMSENIGNNFGHGIKHAIKVTLEAGTLMYIEGESAGYSKKYLESRVRLAQCSGLLHDMKRGQENHAVKGAGLVKEILQNYPGFEPGDIEDISNAIYNHEAFKNHKKTGSPEGALVSDCLYDADKFRWGPDNFAHTVWNMIEYSDIPFSKFISLYPKGMEWIEKIKYSFRTKTGKIYGPSFIDTGLAIGDELYKTIQKEFSDYL